jgi:hypothetical protein
MTVLAIPAIDTQFEIAGREFRSRLMVGTGKYTSNELMVAAIEGRKTASSITWIRRASFCWRTPLGATRRTTRFGTPGWRVQPASMNGSSWKSSATRKRCFRTWRVCSKPRAC